MENWASGAAIFIFALLWAQIFLDYRKKLMRIVPGVREVASKKQEFSSQIADAEKGAQDFIGSLGDMRDEIISLDEKRVELQAKVNPVEMIRIPAGTLRMGTNLANHEDENPEHRVRIKSFYIDQFEVTNLQYKDFVDASGHRDPAHWFNGTFPNQNLADHPVTNVTWEDANAYAQWVGKRLPSEAEWERAARGEKNSDYPWGRALLAQDSANFENVREGTSSVRKFEKGQSEFGIWDMCGNVGEWTNDWYDPNYYHTSPESDPPGPTEGRQKVYRGGGYHCQSRRHKSAGTPPHDLYELHGIHRLPLRHGRRLVGAGRS